MIFEATNLHILNSRNQDPRSWFLVLNKKWVLSYSHLVQRAQESLEVGFNLHTYNNYSKTHTTLNKIKPTLILHLPQFYYLETKNGNYVIKVRQSRKQIKLSWILSKNERWISTSKITTSRLVQKRVYLLAKRT